LLFTGLYWQRDRPTLTGMVSGREHERPVELGDAIGWEIVGPRRCIGIYDRQEHRRRPCPADMLTPSEGQCDLCQRADPSRLVARGQAPSGFEHAPFVLYLAWFGDGLHKVGITAERRGAGRLCEQGALSYCLLARGPFTAIRQAETLLTSSANRSATTANSSGVVADRRWHEEVQALVAEVGGCVIPLDNGAAGRCRFGFIANWRRLAADAELHLRAVGLDGQTTVIAFDIPFLELPGRLGRTEARVTFVPRGTLALHQRDQPELEWERGCYRRMAAHGTRVGLISAFMGRHLASNCGVPPALMIPVYDGVTRSEWSRQVPAIPLPRPAEAGFMLAMGRAHPYKGFDDLLDALPLLRGGDVPHLVLAAVTEDDEPSEYQRHLQQRVAKERHDVTVFTRFSWGVRALIGHPALRAVIVPSRCEPFGRIPMEVYSHPAASGASVIAAATGGLEEVVIGGETGFACTPGSPPALADAVTRGFRASPEEQARLHAVGRRLVAERYTYEANVARFLCAIGASGIGRP
jgi:glycosyltransferase involved in cell wall biosynthesis